MAHPAEKFVTVIEGPFLVVRHCKICGFMVQRKKGHHGRGAGFREGNKQRGLIIQHVKSAHPKELEADAI